MFIRLLRNLIHSVTKLFKRSDSIEKARKKGVTIGQNCRLIDVNFGSEPYLVKLGNHVSISQTQFITHDGSVWVFREKNPEINLFKPITVGNNVFIGFGCIILPGVNIGDNVIIGAGSVVAKDIPSDCVAAGIPARPIKKVEEYYLKHKSNFVYTKSLNKSAKRDFLIRKFDLQTHNYNEK